MTENSPLETVIGVLVAVAVAAQTWVVVNEASHGDAGRQVARWWALDVRPRVVRVIEWLDARALTEQMVAREIEPMLKREPT